MNDEIKEILDGFKEILDNPTTIDECCDGRIIEIDRSYDLYLDEIKALLDYITNLQEENEYSDYCNEQLRKKIANLEYKIKKAEEDNKQLKELCDKYEEEHNTTFQEWLKELKEGEK